MSQPLPIAVLISGNGTNLQALLDAKEQGTLSVDIRGVFSNVASAYGLQRARKHGVPTACRSHKDFPSREAFDREIDTILKAWGVELVVLAGFMRLLSPWFVERWYERLINIHPALCPAFPGVHAQRQAVEYGVKQTGCTVFFVDANVDTGPIIAQATVPVFPSDSEERLSQRLLIQEHRLLVQVLQWIAEEQIRVEGRLVWTPESTMPPPESS